MLEISGISVAQDENYTDIVYNLSLFANKYNLKEKSTKDLGFSNL